MDQWPEEIAEEAIRITTTASIYETVTVKIVLIYYSFNQAFGILFSEFHKS